MGTTYEMTYFGVRGRGEAIRMLFDLAGVAYKEFDIPFGEWPQYKQKQPFGYTPVLKVACERGAVTLSQHVTILRFLANKFGYASKDPVEAALQDQYVDGFADLFFNGYFDVVLPTMQKDMEGRAKGIEKFVSEQFEPMLKRYEGFMKDSKSGWLVGDKMSWADIYVGEWVDRVGSMKPGLLDKYPGLLDECRCVQFMLAV